VPWSVLGPLAVPVGLYLLFLVGSIVASPDPGASTRGLTDFFTFTTLLMAPFLVRGERQVRLVVDSLIVLAALLAIEGLAQFLFGYGDIDRRIRGPFSHYMTFSGFLLVCDLLLLAAMIYTRRWRTPWRWVALGVINAALLGSYTRNAWVALALSLTLMIAIRVPRLLSAYVPAVVLFIALAPVPILHRVLSIVDLRDSSNYDRLCMVEAGLNMVRQRPVFGVGPDLVRRFYPIYRAPSAPRYDVPHLHNSILQIAAERGLPSLAAYLAMTFVGAVAAWRWYVREGGRRGPRADLYMGVLLSLLAFNLAGLFENNWGDTEVQRPILFVLAIPFCLHGSRREAQPPAGQ
jgi:putative inorganic carbon (HCO3(-)) transporter